MAHTGAITCFQHDGRKVISGSEKTVKMWDIHTGECVQDLLTDLGGVWQVKFDERRCVAAVQRGNLTYVEVSIVRVYHGNDANHILDPRFWSCSGRQVARGAGKAQAA
jgi:F-box and WD-40 domain protein CDC4